MSRFARALTLGLTMSLMVGVLSPLQAGASRSQRRHEVRQAPRPVPIADDALHRAFRSGRLSEAQYVLKRVESLFRFKRVKREFGDVTRPDPHAATLLLRDLALRLNDLSEKDQKRALSILARPDDPNDPDLRFLGIPPYKKPKVSFCSPNFNYCLHWASQGDQHAPDPTDSDSNGVPDYVDSAIATMDNVWQQEVVTLGYRAPKEDSKSSNHGPNEFTDIYLADIGDKGLYGYCTTDDPNASKFDITSFDFSAYCVLDEDYANSEFPGTPLGNLQVTAAHEFFHAIQYAYDATEDLWLIEGSAAAMEDVVYDDINDNYQFLLGSQLVNPRSPLDNGAYSDDSPPYAYGAWLWWRFLTEYLSPTPDIRDESVIRRIWERADSAPGGADDYSLLATKKVAKSYGTGFKKLFSDWGAFLYQPERFDEGLEYASFLRSMGQDTHASWERSFTLSSAGPTSPWFSKRLDHLTSAFFRFRPGPNVTAADLLRIKVDGPARWKGTSATLLSISGSTTTTKRFRFSKKGIGTVKVAFPDEAILILQNASTRIRDCYTAGTLTSCMGVPKDDNKLSRAKAKLIEN